MTSSGSVKKKSFNEKEIIDFFYAIEDRFQNDESKIKEFIEIINQEGNLNEEEIITKLKNLFQQCPILIFELNKILPKNNKLPLLNQENSDEFFEKLKNIDEDCYKEFIKVIVQYKDEDINIETLSKKVEDILIKYPELLEEAMLFIDHKKLNTNNYRKNNITKNNNTVISSKQNNANPKENLNSNENNQSGSKKENIIPNKTNNSATNKEKYSSNDYYFPYISPKIQMSPEYIFFNGLKEIFPPEIYEILIKILYLFNEGIISQYEFTVLITPYFNQENHQKLLEFFKSLTHSKTLNRRQHAIFDRPMCEMDFSKTRKITGYYELPKEYPIKISSGRTDFENSIFNDRLITIPTGSEDDKNPMKKNHYEESLFAFEDKRYEIDMQIEIFQYAINKLTKFNEKVNNGTLKINELNEELIEKEIGKNVKRLIIRYYKEYGLNVVHGLVNNPQKIINVVIKRFNNRIEEAKKQKEDDEKSIKSHFDKIYIKSFDYRSFKFKNFDKRNNNSKAFLREIISRKKDKLITSNINVLKGGTDNSEFFTTLNLKYDKENILNKTKGLSSLILLGNIDVNSMRKKLPEIKIIFENLDILKFTISIIYYQIFNISNIDQDKLVEYFNPLFYYFFGLDLSGLVDNLKNNSNFVNDKNNNYSNVIESIRNRQILSDDDYSKFYQLDKLAMSIKEINVDEAIKINGGIKKEEEKDIEQISLSQSLNSQDNGKTFKDIISFNQSNDKNNNEIDITKILFYPPKENGDIIFYANEHCFIFLRYIFCIYERLNKLNEYSFKNAESLLNVKSDKNDNNEENKMVIEKINSKNGNSVESLVFKNFIIIYKALLLKKIENANVYEELCRDILGNESYFLFNMDKLINSLIKIISTILGDNLSKDVLNLFKFEINRKSAPNEKLYFANYIQLLDNNSLNNFRILINPKIYVMTIHIMEIPVEPNKKDYHAQFKEFVNKTLQASNKKLYEYNQSSDDPFNVYLRRNIQAIKPLRTKENADLVSNNLLFRFDYATKKLQYLKSDCDMLFYKTGNFNKKKRLETKMGKNLMFISWLNKENN
jgi:histone deacetylase complex regulatory component SIN3